MSETTNNQFLSTCIACGHTVAKPLQPAKVRPAADRRFERSLREPGTRANDDSPYVSFAVIGLFLLIIVIAVLSQ